MKEPSRLLERARELAQLKYSIAQIANICEQEGILSTRTGRPFSESSVRYWLTKYNIRPNPRHKSKSNKEMLRIIYTRSMQSMGMKPDQIEKELKELL